MPLAPDAVKEILRSARRIAVVGLSPKPERPSHGVARYLQREGYTILPVRPATVEPILGERVYPDLIAAQAAGPIDIVDVFRQSAALPSLVNDILVIRPKLVWTQLGVVHEDFTRAIEAAGIPLVVDHCLAVEHNHLLRA